MYFVYNRLLFRLLFRPNPDICKLIAGMRCILISLNVCQDLSVCVLSCQSELIFFISFNLLRLDLFTFIVFALLS